jgi:hypothetical protein
MNGSSLLKEREVYKRGASKNLLSTHDATISTSVCRSAAFASLRLST